MYLLEINDSIHGKKYFDYTLILPEEFPTNNRTSVVDIGSFFAEDMKTFYQLTESLFGNFILVDNRKLVAVVQN